MQKRNGTVGTINNMHDTNTHAPASGCASAAPTRPRRHPWLPTRALKEKYYLSRWMPNHIWLGPHLYKVHIVYIPIEYNGLVLLHSNICYHWNWSIILLNFCITFTGSSTNQKLHYVKSTLQTWRYVKSALESTFWNKNTKSLFQSQLLSQLRSRFQTGKSRFQSRLWRRPFIKNISLYFRDFTFYVYYLLFELYYYSHQYLVSQVSFTPWT